MEEKLQRLQISYIKKTRFNKIADYLITYPFSTIQKIYDEAYVTRNWDDVKKDLEELDKLEIIFSVYDWDHKVYYTQNIQDGLNVTMVAFLIIKDMVLDEIEHNPILKQTDGYACFLKFYKLRNISKIPKTGFGKRIHSYKYGLDTNNILSHMLAKFLDIYYIKTKIILHEEKTMCSSYYKDRIREKRIREITLFMHIFWKLLKAHKNTEINDIVNSLDRTYKIDLMYYNQLCSNTSWNTRKKMALCYKVLAEGKKTASEMYGISMKQTSNIIKPLLDKNGKLDTDLISELRAKEECRDWDRTKIIDVGDYRLLEFIKEYLHGLKKDSKEYKKTEKWVKETFSSVDIYQFVS